jgi:flagellar protein FlbT
MSKAMQLTLKAGDRVFINGAVLRAGRKVTLELLNDATFLLEGHVLQPEETTTPLRQLYFVLQTALMDPQNAAEAEELFSGLLQRTKAAFSSSAILAGLASAEALVASGRCFDALREIRRLLPVEAEILARPAAPAPVAAAA